jgi:hypothetical protein
MLHAYGHRVDGPCLIVNHDKTLDFTIQLESPMKTQLSILLCV